MIEPIQHTIKSGDLNLCVFEWKGNSSPYLLVHATGFHARCWDKVIKFLGGKHVFAIDLMGHGRSDKPSPPITTKRYCQNVIDTILALNLKEIVGAGHSMGGVTVTGAAAQLPERFQRLILLDPVIMNTELSKYFEGVDPLTMHIARRRREFASPEEMMKNLENRPNFSLWDKDVLRDYCVYGLLGTKLACDPMIEAATYVACSDPWIYDELSKVIVPVDVVRARDVRPDDVPMSFACSPTNPKLASLFPHGRDIQLKNHSHFIPMEDPQLTADLINQAFLN